MTHLTNYEEKKGEIRNWMTNEVTIFAEVLADNEFNFAECLEKEDLKIKQTNMFLIQYQQSLEKG